MVTETLHKAVTQESIDSSKEAESTFESFSSDQTVCARKTRTKLKKERFPDWQQQKRGNPCINWLKRLCAMP